MTIGDVNALAQAELLGSFTLRSREPYWHPVNDTTDFHCCRDQPVRYLLHGRVASGYGSWLQPVTPQTAVTICVAPSTLVETMQMRRLRAIASRVSEGALSHMNTITRAF